MKLRVQAPLDMNVFLLLLKESLGSIPFNIALAILLGLDFLYNNVPIKLVCVWLFAILFISIGRWVYSNLLIKNEYYRDHINSTHLLFIILTTLTGLIWGSAYFIFLSYVNYDHTAIIVLVLGGMSAGAIASLSVYLPAYYAYVLSMFLPIIVYNFSMLQIDRAIIGFMYLMFVAMVFVTANITSRLLYKTFKLGKEKDVLIDELTQINLKLEQSIGEAQEMSITDCLTGLYNRRYFDMIFKNELKKAKIDKYAINLVLIDIDNFKFINDSFGHPAGDDFLIYVANTLKKSINCESYTIFRLGGDEFAAILTHMQPKAVLLLCSDIQKKFNQHNPYKNVTLSMGMISISSFEVMDLQHIITAADNTLYQAKKDGKNRIISKIID